MTGATGISCPSASACVAVDSAGQAASFDATTWSAPREVSTVGRRNLVSVSCASPQSCAATDDQGDAVTLQGDAWMVARGLDRPYDSTSAVSCAMTRFCVEVDGHGNALLSGTAGGWRMEAVAGGQPTALSCAASTLCLAVDGAGDAVSFNGVTWSTPAKVDRRAYLSSLSCHGTSLCVAAGSGRATTFDGRSWGSARLVDPAHVIPNSTSVSCPSSRWCALTTDDGWATWSSGRWSGFRRGRVPAVISCASSSFCAGGNAGTFGTVKTFNGHSWGAAKSIDRHNITAISCPTATFCAAVDEVSQVMLYNGRSWTRPRRIDSAGTTTSISCASRSSCMVGDWHGNLVSFDGGGWSRPAKALAHRVVAVSCPSARFCEALDASADAVTVRVIAAGRP